MLLRLKLCHVGTFSVLPEWNLVFPCNLTVKSVSVGQIEDSSHQTVSCNNHLNMKNSSIL